MTHTPNRCVAELNERGIAFEFISLPQNVHSVSDVELACGCVASEVVKSLLFIGTQPVLLVLPGDRKVNTDKVKTFLGDTSIRMATRPEVLEITGYPVGTVSPFGIPSAVRVIADDALFKLAALYVGSGQSDSLIKLTQAEFVLAFRGDTASLT